MIEARGYQDEAVGSLRQSFANGNRRIVLQAPTGSGKTVIASHIIRGAEEKGKRIVFLAHRRELVMQCSNKLHDFDVKHGIIMSGEMPAEARMVQVASIQTLWARREKMSLPKADIVVVDECHRSLARTYQQIMDLYPEALVLGLSATPARGDGRGLGHIYTDMVCGPSIKKLIEDGFLVPIRVFAPSRPDLTGVKVRMGDYVESELAQRMDRPELIGDIVENWARIAADRQTVVFATGVGHSIHLKERFRDAGVTCEHIDGKTPKDERDSILKRLADGSVQVVTNCMVLTEGWDCPAVSCAVMARPTKSLVLYLQMAGRIMRPAEGKRDAVIIDHSGAVHEHGFPDESVHWRLDTKGKKCKSETQEEREEKQAQVITCDKCYAQYVGKKSCPECGYEQPRHGKHVHILDGDLGEVDRSNWVRGPHEYTGEEKRRYLRMLHGIRFKHCYKPGWASYIYKEKFGTWPPKTWDTTPIEPSTEVSAYVRSRQIRYAKGRSARRDS